MKWLKKFVFWGVVGFVILFLIFRPNEAAAAVKTVIEAIILVGTSLWTFGQALVDGG